MGVELNCLIMCVLSILFIYLFFKSTIIGAVKTQYVAELMCTYIMECKSTNFN